MVTSGGNHYYTSLGPLYRNLFNKRINSLNGSSVFELISRLQEKLSLKEETAPSRINAK